MNFSKLVCVLVLFSQLQLLRGEGKTNEITREAVAEAEAEVKPDGGRVLLRYSGTEPKVRLLIEGRDAAVLERWSNKICDTIKQQIGA